MREIEEHLIKIIDPEHDSLRFYYLGNRYETKVKHFGAKPSFDVNDPLVI